MYVNLYEVLLSGVFVMYKHCMTRTRIMNDKSVRSNKKIDVRSSVFLFHITILLLYATKNSCLAHTRIANFCVCVSVRNTNRSKTLRWMTLLNVVCLYKLFFSPLLYLTPFNTLSTLVDIISTRFVFIYRTMMISPLPLLALRLLHRTTKISITFMLYKIYKYTNMIHTT